jgi:hypothetical protein
MKYAFARIPSSSLTCGMAISNPNESGPAGLSGPGRTNVPIILPLARITSFSPRRWSATDPMSIGMGRVPYRRAKRRDSDRYATHAAWAASTSSANPRNPIV